MSQLGTRLDNWLNTVTGLGNSLRDKVQGWELESTQTLSDSTLETLVRSDGMARKIALKIPEAAFREGVDVVIEDDKELSKTLQGRIDELDALSKLEEGFGWGRVFGGAVAVLGVNDNQSPEQPVNLANIQSIDWIDVLDRREIEPDVNFTHARRVEAAEHFRYVDPLDRRANFGAKIHRSRLLFFPGAQTTREQKQRNKGWDDSVLQVVFDALRSFQNNFKSVTHLISDSSQGVFKIKGLMKMLRSQGRKEISERIAMIDESRSVARAILLDEDGEEFERKNSSFAGLADTIDRTMLYVASAADMPATVLFGRQPAGLNATGDNDTRSWYDSVNGWRNRVARRPLERLVELLIAAEGKDPNSFEWSVNFRSLWQMSLKEELEARKIQAEVDEKYTAMGALDGDQIAESRFTTDGFSHATNPVDQDEGRQKMEEVEAQIQKQRAEGQEPGQGDTVTDPEGKETTAKDQDAAFAGVQIKEMREIILAISNGEMPKESAIKLIVAAYPISEGTAREIINPVEVNNAGTVGVAAPQRTPSQSEEGP